MKTLFATATIVATCLSVYCLSGNVKAQGGPRTGTAIAQGVRVIDIKRVFAEYTAFNKQMEQLTSEVKLFEEQQREKNKTIINMTKEAQDRIPGTPERKEMEKRIFKLRTDLGADAKIRQSELMEKRAKIYFHTYNIIKGEVAYYCKVKNVAVVISYNGEEADPNNPKSIMQAMNSNVIAQNGVDITDTILAELNRGSAAVSQRPNRRTSVPRSNRSGLRQ